MKATWEYQTSRGLFCTLPAKPNFTVYELKQVHGTEVVDLRKAPLQTLPEADGAIASYDSEVIPAIKTADCLPILLLGKEAYALLHAGWRGLADPIMAHPLLQQLDINEIVIGPAISAQAFEVSEDFQANFKGSPHFKREEGRLCFNLWQEAATQAARYFPQASVFMSGQCTFLNQNYHSYRRDQTTQRNWNLFLTRNLGKLS